VALQYYDAVRPIAKAEDLRHNGAEANNVTTMNHKIVEKSPLKFDPLRVPGQSIDGQLFDMAADKMLTPLMLAGSNAAKGRFPALAALDRLLNQSGMHL
jgi:hypothetical protein